MHLPDKPVYIYGKWQFSKRCNCEGIFLSDLRLGWTPIEFLPETGLYPAEIGLTHIHGGSFSTLI